jgi:tRNA A-37 threonylcarbamoyl transferase component Bud32
VMEAEPTVFHDLQSESEALLNSDQSANPGLTLDHVNRSSWWKEVVSRQMVLTVIVATVFVLNVGWWAYSTLQQSAQQNIRQWLNAELEARLSRLEIWMELRRSVTARVALAPETRELVGLVRSGLASDSSESLSAYIARELGAFQIANYFIVNGDGIPLVNALPDFSLPKDRAFFDETIRDKTSHDAVVTGPLWINRGGSIEPTIMIVSPIPALDSSTDGFLVAELGLKQGVDGVLASSPGVLGAPATATGTQEQSVEAHLYDADARIISSGVQGGKAFVFPEPVATHQPEARTRVFTLDSYKNQKAQEVVSASTWVSNYMLGLAVEVPEKLAFHSLSTVMRAFALLFLMIIAGGLATLAWSLFALYLERRARSAEATATKLGQYTLELSIGQGGMGEVYKARHAMLRRPVAIKLIRSTEVNEHTLRQFEKEVQSTASLSHPNTIQIYDFGRTNANIFYYVMEYLHGITLRELVRVHGAQPEGRVVHILKQLCDSLSEAHGRGMLHRDIKPANVMLCQLGGMDDVVKVLDFGLVKEVSAEGKPEKDMFAGTVKVVAPEVAEMPGSESVRSDIFSVGVVGYFLLTGAYLFDERDPQEYLRKVVRIEPVRPSQRLGRAVSIDIEQVILRCLSKDATKRYGSTAELTAALMECRDAGSWTYSSSASWWKNQADSAARGLSSAKSAHEDMKGLNLLVDTRFRI